MGSFSGRGETRIRHFVTGYLDGRKNRQNAAYVVRTKESCLGSELICTFL